MPVCEKCKKPFPNRITVDGRKRLVSKGRKYCFDCVPFGTHNTKNLTELSVNELQPECTCISCGRKFRYKRSAGGSITKCNSCFQSQRRKKLKKYFTEYKGSKCIVCGYKKCLEVLTFHHLESEKKDFHIAHSWNRSLEYLKNEVDKCVLMCANCHIELHNGIITLEDMDP